MAHSYRTLATVVQALGVEDEARNAKGEWTSGGGSVGSSHVDSGKIGIATFHGTTDEVLQKIMREGITVQRDKTYAGDSVYYGDRGESVFVTTSADAAANWAEIRAHSATPELQKYYPPRGGPVVLELSVPRKDWKTFKADTEAGSSDPRRATNFYGAQIRPEWIKGVFDVKSGGGSTYNPTLVPHKMSADEDMVSAWVVLFSDGSSTKKASAGRHSYRHLDRTLSSTLERLKLYSEDQPRAADGRFGSVGSSHVDSPAFKAWFGKSKVVDASGKPLVVYKAMYPYDWTKENGGNPGPEITSINRTTDLPSFNHGEPGVKIAGFFGDASTANRFAGGMGSASVYPVYLSLQTPLVIEANGKNAGDVQFGDSGKPFRDAINSGKYDGVIIKNTKDEGTVYVALKPEQIKSAIGNKGTYDPKNPHIGMGAGRHSYRHLDRTLSELAEQHERPFLRLVPQPLAPRQNPPNAPRFETDPVEAKRVAKILAVLFAQAAANAPITASIRAKLGITDEDVNAISEKIGRDRAAEIMGLRWDGENLVPDPNAEKAITTTTENDVNETVDAAVTAAAAPLEPGDTWAPGQGPNDTPTADTGLSDDEELALAIAALYVFSQYRPDAVADYETANSQNVMALTAYAAAGVTDVFVTDGELDDFPCIEANGQTWSIEQALANPLEHKKCQRQFWPLGADGMQLAAKRSRRIAPLPFTPNPEEGT